MISKKSSPWVEFTDWLFTPNFNIELSEKTIKGINPRSVLCMFSNFKDLTIFLNEYFNDFYVIFKLNPVDFYKFIKEVVHKKEIEKYSTSFLKLEKKDPSLKLRNKLPHLKTYEIDYLLKLIKDTEEEEGLLQYLELKEDKKPKKLTKKEKQEIKNKIEGCIKPNKIITFKDWKSNFSLS